MPVIIQYSQGVGNDLKFHKSSMKLFVKDEILLEDVISLISRKLKVRNLWKFCETLKLRIKFAQMCTEI